MEWDLSAWKSRSEFLPASKRGDLHFLLICRILHISPWNCTGASAISNNSFPLTQFRQEEDLTKEGFKKTCFLLCPATYIGCPSGPCLPGPEDQPGLHRLQPLPYTATATAVVPLIAVFQRVRPVTSNVLPSPGSCLRNSKSHWGMKCKHQVCLKMDEYVNEGWGALWKHSFSPPVKILLSTEL